MPIDYSAIAQSPIAPGTPLFKTGTINGSGANTVIAQPGVGSGQIVITAFSIQNESATPVTIILQAGSSQFWRVLGQNQGDGEALTFVPGREIKLGYDNNNNGNALVINLSTGVQVGYSIQFYYAQ